VRRFWRWLVARQMGTESDTVWHRQYRGVVPQQKPGSVFVGNDKADWFQGCRVYSYALTPGDVRALHIQGRRALRERGEDRWVDWNTGEPLKRALEGG